MEIEPLIQKFVADRESLSELEIGLLVDAVANDSDLLRSLHEQLVVDDHISQRYAVDRSRFRSQVDQRIHDYLEGEQELNRRATELRDLAQDQMQQWRSARTRRLQWGVACAAAVALLVAGVGGYFAMNVWQTVGFVASTTEGVKIHRGSSDFPAQEGTRILVGDQIITPAGGWLTLEYSDLTKVNILGASGVLCQRYHSPHGGTAKKLTLQSGELFASVAPQEQPMRLETPLALALVLGTELQLSARTDQTRLEVIQGKVDLRRHEDGKTVSVESNQAAIASASSLTVAPVLWPSNNDGLVFQFQTNDKPAIATLNKQTQPVVLKPFGNARWNHDFAMHFAGEPTLSASGGFSISNNVATQIGQQLAAGQAVSLEAVVTPLRNEHFGFIVGLVDGERGLKISQQGTELVAHWVGDQTSTASLGMAESQPTHIAVVVSTGSLAVFVNGERRGEVKLSNVSFSTLERARLAFGSKLGEGHWRGVLEGVAVYGRPLAEQEIATNARQYLRSIETRPNVPQVELVVTLIQKSKSPSNEDALPHSSALQVNGFHVQKIIRGNLHGDAKRLFAADWALLDGRSQALAKAANQSVMHVVVERVADNPQIRPYAMADDFQTDADKNATRYLVVDHIIKP